MADKTIPELTESILLEDNYAFPMDSGIQTYKVLWSTIKSFMWNLTIGTFTEQTSITGIANYVFPIETGTGIKKIKASTLKSYISESAVLPIGSVIAFMDFGGLLSFNTAVWAYIAGQTISDAGSPLNTVSLPDSSNRMLLGYGSEAGGDVGSASFTTSPFGNANHQIDLNHDHVYEAAWRITATGAYGIPRDDTTSLPAVSCGIINPQNSPSYRLVTGATLASGNTTDNSCTTAGTIIKNSTYTSLSSTQSILPRSIKVRWLLRYK